MKPFFLLLLASLAGLSFLQAEPLTRKQALALGADNNGEKNGHFWFSDGADSPPFLHAGSIELTQGSTAIRNAYDGKATTAVGSSHQNGGITRMDFFTSANGKPWITGHVIKPELENTRPTPPADPRSLVQEMLSPAARHAIIEGKIDLLRDLLKHGLEVNSPIEGNDELDSGDTLLHKAVNSLEALKLVPFLLENGADQNIRNRHGRLPIESIIDSGEPEDIALCKLLAKRNAPDVDLDGIPKDLIPALFPENASNEIYFISYNGKDPSEEMLAEIRKTHPKARPASSMETIEPPIRGAHTSFRDKKTKEFGIRIGLASREKNGQLQISISYASGTFLSSRGETYIAQKKYGYRYLVSIDSWVS